MGSTQIFKRDIVISNQPNLTKTFPKCRLSDCGLTISESHIHTNSDILIYVYYYEKFVRQF